MSVSRFRALMALVNLGGMRSQGRIRRDYTIGGNEYHNTRPIQRGSDEKRTDEWSGDYDKRHRGESLSLNSTPCI